LKNPFVKFILEWLNEYDKINDDTNGWLFPSLKIRFTTHYFDFGSEKPMSIQNLDAMLKRLDPTMTSCIFRYGGSEKYLALGYTPYDMKEVGDWESTRMPEIYADKKGLTIAQRRWSEDVR